MSSYWEDKGGYPKVEKPQTTFTNKEAEFLYFQLAHRKDYFQEEMNRGVKSVERLKELSFIMDTLDKGISFFINNL